MSEEFIKQYGILGFVTVVLCGVIVYIYKEAKREIQTERNLNKELQAARLADSIESRDKLIEPIEKLTKQQEQSNDLLIKLVSQRRK